MVVLFGVFAAPASASEFFSSPSRNISCDLDAQSVRCDIGRRNWKITTPPAGCPSDSDFGQGLFVTRAGNRGRVVCAGDTALGARRVLPYGRSVTVGRITCMSRSTGMTCRNGRGHGFFLSRESFRLF